MTKKAAWLLIAAGGGLTIADKITAGDDPAKGAIFGDQGILAPIAKYSPINPGLLLLAVGAAFLFMKRG